MHNFCSPFNYFKPLQYVLLLDKHTKTLNWTQYAYYYCLHINVIVTIAIKNNNNNSNNNNADFQPL